MKSLQVTLSVRVKFVNGKLRVIIGTGIVKPGCIVADYSVWPGETITHRTIYSMLNGRAGWLINISPDLVQNFLHYKDIAIKQLNIEPGALVMTIPHPDAMKTKKLVKEANVKPFSHMWVRF